jgi:hypothetical protein
MIVAVERTKDEEALLVADALVPRGLDDGGEQLGHTRGGTSLFQTVSRHAVGADSEVVARPRPCRRSLQRVAVG